jgi:DNA-binding NtrC family response regulator
MKKSLRRKCRQAVTSKPIHLQEMSDSSFHIKNVAVRNIIIIDDDEDTHLLIKASLKNYPINYADFYDGVSAMRAIEELHADMIFLDVMMPNGSGSDVMKYILTKNISLPAIIIITSLRDSTLMQNALNIGASEFINKPIQPDEIRGVVQKYLFQKSGAS